MDSATDRSNAGRTRARPFLPILAWLALAVVGPQICHAQGNADSRAVPRQDYFLAKSLFNEGDFATAQKGFRSAGGSGIRNVEGRWVDSVCYLAMIGECYYQLGEPARALDSYTAALELFLAHRDWMLRVEFPATLGPGARGPRRPITWGVTTRRTQIAAVPSKMLTLRGNLNNDQAIRQGGAVQLPEFYPLYVDEIVQCTALALRRRMELMGPACASDPLTSQLVAGLSRRPAPPNHWSQSWIDALLGLAYASEGKAAQAISELQKSLFAAGQYDHPLTATALLELGKLAFHQGKFQAAATFFLEATYTAAVFSQYDIMEEAFRHGSVNHLVSGQQGIYPPLDEAAAWSRRTSKFLETSLWVSTAENFAVGRDAARAAAALSQARRLMNRSEMTQSALGARFQYQTALVNFQAGKIPTGQAALASALTFQRTGSRWLFQIALVNKMYANGTISQRVAGELFDNVLREPAGKDWTAQPLETLSVTNTPHPLPMEHWFEIAILRKEHEKALEIADRIRRHRFYSTLPLGGRLLALRWVLDAPKESLSPAAQLQRQDLLMKYPRYAELARQADALREALDAAPLVPDEEDAAQQQSERLQELGKLSAVQELILQEIALRREPSEFAFPPLRSVKEVQESMQPGQLVLAFFATSRYVSAFLFSRDKYAQWQVDAPAKVRADVVAVLQQLGNHERNVPLSVNVLQDDGWKTPARRLLRQLTNNAADSFWDDFEELVIVPDGVLWYVPFEALPVGNESLTRPLISRLRIRYVPTFSLAMPREQGSAPLSDTAVIVGKMFPRDSQDVGDAAFAELRQVLPGATRLPDRLPAASGLFATICDRLVVLDEIDDTDRAPYDWSPLPIDRGKPGSSLGNWLTLPWGGPRQIILPAYHTPAEESLKRGGTGNEMFLTVCGLMATGNRTLLLSRWRTGGQSSYDLVREFAQELPFLAAANAWQRSVRLGMQSEIDPEREPRVKPFSADVGIKATHPFFWSGYLLVNTGQSPKTD